MRSLYRTSFYSIRFLIREMYGTAKEVWQVGAVADTGWASYWQGGRCPAAFFRLQFHSKTDDRYCVLCQYLSSVLRFYALRRGYGSSLFLQRGLSYPREQSPPCGYPIRCTSRKLAHPIPLAVRSRQRTVLAIQGRLTVYYRIQSFVCAFRSQKKCDIGHLRNKKSHQGTETIKQESLAKGKSTMFGQSVHSAFVCLPNPGISLSNSVLPYWMYLLSRLFTQINATWYDSKKGKKLYNWDYYIPIFDIRTLLFMENKLACRLSTKFLSGEPNTPKDKCLSADIQC